MSAFHHATIRKGTRAYLALTKLQAIGGSAGLNAWMRSVGWESPTKSFQRDIVEKLLTAKLVVPDSAAAYVITPAGLDLLGIPVDAQVCAAPVPAGPRYVGPKVPLSRRNMVRLTENREGSLDFLAVPSRIGDVLVAHGTKA